MGWLSNLLLPGRLRTGPTVLLPARPDPKTLLAIAQLADPDARLDGDDIVAGGSRIFAALELTGDVLAKLGVGDEDRLWACRVAAEGPLPVNFFDKTLAEGIAYRLGGWSLCQGEPTDLSDSDLRAAVVYLPAAPAPEEAIGLLGELLRPAESADPDRWPDGQLVDGIVHVAVNGGGVADIYAGADTVVTIEEGHKIPPAARARWPYLTEIVVARLSAIEPAIEPAPAPAIEPAPEPEPEPESGLGAEAEDVDAEADIDPRPEIDPQPETVTDAESTSGDGGETASDAGVAATDEDGKGVRDDTALLERAAVALAIADRLQGMATDQGAFQLAEPDDILPGRYS
ncbi:hypothetical protein N5079_32825 [Planotetraspora sp. A-T 1434]|uniref:hypothetical protein n=1 Tax=Planotetraspora sp. A-T 1434 TaxID=2979219 RepID=UPI0021C01AA2|nr:hypothetical protein [Planotetraspora sp. A-T 1434]MCT9934999.1 hypothetical protein [Planotetraspora sp. A-T 1434]